MPTQMHVVMGKVAGKWMRKDFRAETAKDAQAKFVKFMMKHCEVTEDQITDVKSSIGNRGVA